MNARSLFINWANLRWHFSQTKFSSLRVYKKVNQDFLTILVTLSWIVICLIISSFLNRHCNSILSSLTQLRFQPTAFCLYASPPVLIGMVYQLLCSSSSIASSTCETFGGTRIFWWPEMYVVNDNNGLLCFLVSHCKYLQPLLQQNPDFSAEALLHKIEAYRCFRASDLISILSSLLSQSESEPDKYPMDLLIIDSVAAPFRQPDFATVKERCEMLNKMAKLLNQFTIVTNACIVLTNHITTKLVESQ